MGKKGSRRKKTKPIKSPVKKIEARLRGYWNKEAWEEFITLFQRQFSKAEKSALSYLWNPAVYNLMVRTAFKDRDIQKIDRLCREIRRYSDISHDNKKCLHVLEVLLDVHNGNAWPGLADTLPTDLPGPFAELSSGLNDLLSDKSLSPLSQYADGTYKKARKGEKHYARAVSIARGFNSLRKDNFDPSSIRPLTRLKKDIEETQKSLFDNTGVYSQVLADMSILVVLMHKLYSKKKHAVDINSISSFFKAENFQSSDHPAVQNMAEAVFVLGNKFRGPAWEYKLRSALHNFFPLNKNVDMPDHIQDQLIILADLNDDESAFPVVIEYILGSTDWSARERILLSMAGLLNTTINWYDILEHISHYVLVGNEQGADSIVDAVLTRVCIFLKNIVEHHAALNLDDYSITERAAVMWHGISVKFSFADHTEILDSLINTVCDSSVPDSVLLSLIHKRVERRSDISSIYSLSRIIKKRAPLKVSHEDIERFARQILEATSCPNIFVACKQCLSAGDYEFLVQKFIFRLYENAFETGEVSPMYDDFKFNWYNMPDELILDLAETLGESFPLYGLLLLTKSIPDYYPMPYNAAQANFFLEHLPPDEMLYDILLEMFTWPSTPYRNTFLGKIIEHLADYITQELCWSELAMILGDKRLKVVSLKVWEIWEKRNLFQYLRDDSDFSHSVDILKPLVKKTQVKSEKKKKKRTRSVMYQKTLIEEMLKELEQLSRKGK